MKESFWGIFIVSLGIVSIVVVYIFQSLTTSTEHNYHLLKETTEAAMFDAFDLAAYRHDGTIKIDTEKFVENFVRRFAENASLARKYVIKIYDVNETPPKVSIQVSSTEKANTGEEIYEFNITDRISAILETPY